MNIWNFVIIADEVALNLGTSFDAFLRHHPTLRENFLNSLTKVYFSLIHLKCENLGLIYHILHFFGLSDVE